jgi:hypothetical protein
MCEIGYPYATASRLKVIADDRDPLFIGRENNGALSARLTNGPALCAPSMQPDELSVFTGEFLIGERASLRDREG